MLKNYVPAARRPRRTAPAAAAGPCRRAADSPEQSDLPAGPRSLGQPAPARLFHNIYKSIYRTTAFPKTERERSEAFFNSFLLHIQPAKIEKHALRFTYTFGLGLLSMYLFLLLTISGLLLMFVYVPSTEQAYGRMQDLHSSVSFGYILRGMHFWSANAMIAVVFFHMCRVFYTGAYKAPREFNWVIGVILMVLTLVLGFTGYLLPWDQLAFWAITVGAGIAGKASWVSDHINALPHPPGAPTVPAIGRPDPLGPARRGYCRAGSADSLLCAACRHSAGDYHAVYRVPYVAHP